MALEKQKYVDMPGKKYPFVGLGTFTIFHKTGDEKAIREAVKFAIDSGYRHIDCAFNYGNEEAIGEAIQDKIKDGTITRDQLFVTTKIEVDKSFDVSAIMETQEHLCHCGYTTRDKSNFNKHVRRHKTATQTTTSTPIKASLKEVTGTGTDASVICETCGKIFTTKWGLSLNRKNKHTLEFKYKCTVCGKGYNQSVQYRFHVSSHLNVALDKCNFCKTEFTSHGSLKRHLDGCQRKDNPFVCDICQKSYNRKYKLDEHMKGKHGELWNTHHNPAHVERAIRESMRKLQLDYIDLFLLHWPFAFKDGDEIFPRDDDGRIVFADHDYVDTWKAMEKLVDSGLAKSIGVSNCNHKQINRILEVARIPPANTQIEIHPYLLNEKLVDFCRNKGMTITAYAPLGNPSRTWKSEDDPCIFDEPVLQEIAKSKGKTVAQVVLRFHVQRGIVVVPKSITPSRIKENLDIFDFELSNEELSKIASLDRNLRFYAEGIAIDHKYYGFNEEF